MVEFVAVFNDGTQATVSARQAKEARAILAERYPKRKIVNFTALASSTPRSNYDLTYQPSYESTNTSVRSMSGGGFETNRHRH